ncbi:MAG: hypothetical protein JWO39_762 [Gemmatimonadetes bacterium]|jgi:hypothetical protein|nr:hypothetical protein [Gemmatimonadota bacterium]
MNVVRLSAILLVGSTLPALGQIHYTPSVQRYRLHSTVERSQEQNGQKTSGVITNEQQVTVALKAPGSKGTLTDKDTLHFDVTLDSVNMSSNLAVQLPDVQVMQGTKVSGVMLPSGKVLSFGSDTKATDGVDRESIVASMAHFLLTLPATAGAGAKWTDTATTNFSKDGNTLKTSTITMSQVLGDTAIAGQKAWRVHRTSTLIISGTQAQANQQITMDGSGTGEAMYYIGTNGVYLGSTSTQSMKETVKAAGIVIPVVQTATSTVTIIK